MSTRAPAFTTLHDASDVTDSLHRAPTRFWDGNDKRQLIEFDFKEVGGVTTVRFTHRDLWDEEAVRSHEDGWRNCFDNLERVLTEDLAAG